jgi:hypothetical protein
MPRFTAFSQYPRPAEHVNVPDHDARYARLTLRADGTAGYHDLEPREGHHVTHEGDWGNEIPMLSGRCLP